jgi:hypothetical protein
MYNLWGGMGVWEGRGRSECTTLNSIDKNRKQAKGQADVQPVGGGGWGVWCVWGVGG